MNREIKFRAWDKTGNRWLQDRFIQDFLTIGVPDSEEDSGIFNIGTFTKRILVEQYTGLKDKNGREIYEGDILGHEKYDMLIGQMEWLKSRNGWAEFVPLDRFKVIGNIHENPELLNA